MNLIRRISMKWITKINISIIRWDIIILRKIVRFIRLCAIIASDNKGCDVQLYAISFSGHFTDTYTFAFALLTYAISEQMRNRIAILLPVAFSLFSLLLPKEWKRRFKVAITRGAHLRQLYYILDSFVQLIMSTRFRHNKKAIHSRRLSFNGTLTSLRAYNNV